MRFVVSCITAVFLPSLIVILAAVVALNGQTSKPDAPAFSLTSLDGQQFDLGSLRGKVVVLDFWFTGCAPCLEEIPKLNSLVDEFKDKDVVFIAPTWDKEPLLRTFVKDYPFKYHIIPNAQEFVRENCRDGLGSVIIPVHLVINQEGKVELKSDGGLTTEGTGPKRFDDLRNTIARLVNALPAKSK